MVFHRRENLVGKNCLKLSELRPVKVLHLKMSSDSDDETPQLSIHALCALQEFLSEQQEVESESKQQKAARVGGFQEDWQLSQFWYNDDTAEVLAKEALHIAGPKGRIACLSSPTLFQKLCQMKADPTVVLFEYDKRFDAYGEDFVFYDFNEPLSLPKHIAEHSFDLVVGDPPFLQDRCLGLFSQTMKFLAKGKMILCTGSIMEAAVKRLLDMDMCKFKPKHARNLANEFSCYSNYPTRFLNEDT